MGKIRPQNQQDRQNRIDRDAMTKRSGRLAQSLRDLVAKEGKIEMGDVNWAYDAPETTQPVRQALIDALQDRNWSA